MEVESGAVDLTGNTLQILLECEEKEEVLSKQSSPSIYMVPSLVRDLSPSSFTPRVVAIGPLHRQDERLQAFEVQKTTYVHNWLHDLCMVPGQTLEYCAEKVIRSIERIKACYAAGSTTYNDSELAMMMVTDACFILGFVERVSEYKSFRKNILINVSILNDLILIENQIPLFVLEIIFECTIGEEASLTTYIEVLVEHQYFIDGNLVKPHVSHSNHILGFLHEIYSPGKKISPVYESSRRKCHTAKELDRAGMDFKPNTEDENWALAMKLEFPPHLFQWFRIFMGIPPFSWFRRRTLRMPKLHIGDGSDLILKNLVVYEQSADVEKYVSSYLCAMDMLIDTPDDVALLVESKVLTNYLGSKEEVADMINKLCKYITVEFFYHQQWEDMDAYYNSRWPHFIAGLKRKYFNNPWSIIALVAAFVLFTLTVVQTIFTINAA